MTQPPTDTWIQIRTINHKNWRPLREKTIITTQLHKIGTNNEKFLPKKALCTTTDYHYISKS
jgi:hypothetical protein